MGLFLALLVLAAFGSPGETAQGKLEGIVLVIADGTSLELITAARSYSVGAAGSLALDDFPHSALVRTYSASDMVTDSARGSHGDCQRNQGGQPRDWDG